MPSVSAVCMLVPHTHKQTHRTGKCQYVGSHNSSLVKLAAESVIFDFRLQTLLLLQQMGHNAAPTVIPKLLQLHCQICAGIVCLILI